MWLGYMQILHNFIFETWSSLDSGILGGPESNPPQTPRDNCTQVCLAGPTISLSSYSVCFFSVCPILQKKTNFEHHWWLDSCRWPPCPSERPELSSAAKTPSSPLFQGLYAVSCKCSLEFYLDLEQRTSKSQKRVTLHWSCTPSFDANWIHHLSYFCHN